jgi:hypothetical protein
MSERLAGAASVTEVQMRELVSATFATAWAAAEPEVPIWLENEAQPTAPAFVALTITPTTSRQMTQGRVGTRRVMRNLWLQVRLWSALDEGSARLAALGDVAQGILEMVSLSSPSASDEPLTTLAAQAGAGGQSKIGKWYVALLRIPGWYAETK